MGESFCRTPCMTGTRQHARGLAPQRALGRAGGRAGGRTDGRPGGRADGPAGSFVWHGCVSAGPGAVDAPKAPAVRRAAHAGCRLTGTAAPNPSRA
eukprot:gene12334-biopygen14007